MHPLDRYNGIVDDWQAFAEAMASPMPHCVWANPSRVDPAELAALLAADGIVAEPLPWRPGAFRLGSDPVAGRRWWYCAGLAHTQEGASQIPVALLDPRPGERVLDLCAAPGGKTAQIAFALGNRGTLVANDALVGRLRPLQGTLERLGVTNVTTTAFDGTSYPTAAGQFDRVLVDAPCSGEGTLRRPGPIPAGLGAEHSCRQAGRQRALLRKGVQRLKPGGRLVYSTCTFAPEENELVVAAILDEFAGQVQLLPAALPGLVATPGLTHWAGRALDPALAACLRIWPHHNDTGGFFAAVLEKAADARDERPPAAAPLVPEPDPSWLAELSGHFGLPEDHWADFRIHRQATRGLHLVAADHSPPALPRAESVGVFFHRTDPHRPKPTTAGALLLGPHATRQCLDLEPGQVHGYLNGSELRPTQAQLGAGVRGQVLVRFRGHTLGIAVLHPSGTLEGFFPRRWAGCGAVGSAGQRGLPEGGI
jgi:NOL1/NOP2/sun family putative RNA methylase